MTTRIHKQTKVAYKIISWPVFSKFAVVKAIGRLGNTKTFKILKSELEDVK